MRRELLYCTGIGRLLMTKTSWVPSSQPEHTELGEIFVWNSPGISPSHSRELKRCTRKLIVRNLRYSFSRKNKRKFSFSRSYLRVVDFARIQDVIPAVLLLKCGPRLVDVYLEFNGVKVTFLSMIRIKIVIWFRANWPESTMGIFGPMKNV